MQVPAAQLNIAMPKDEHPPPQLPQLFGSVPVATSHPSVCLLPLQSVKPVLQALVQVPVVHAALTTLLLEQRMPQPPQFAVSVLEVTSQPSVFLLPLQSRKPGLQAPLQVPAPQVGELMWAFEQVTPQPPQFAGLLCVFTSQPFVVLLLSQSAKPVLQAPPQAPAVQVAVVMLALEQRRPQVPQFVASVAVDVSHPLVRLFPSQSAKPLSQAPLH